MKADKRFLVIKEIPLYGGKTIPVNTNIYRTHGVYYMDGGLLPEDFQEEFFCCLRIRQPLRRMRRCSLPSRKEPHCRHFSEDS